MTTINAVVVFADVAMRLSNIIPQILAVLDITSTLIDEEVYRKFE